MKTTRYVLMLNIPLALLLTTVVCRAQEPPMLESEAGHQIRCHIPATELAKLQGQSAADQGATPVG